MGNDPPGQFTRVLHPRVGRHGSPPANVIPVGRSVIVPANGSLPNIVLSPRSIPPGQARARARAIRRPASARADDAGDLRRRARPRAGADRRDPPRVGRARLDARRHARLGLPDGPHRPADRRLRAGARVGRPLARRAVGGRARTASSSPTTSTPAGREHTIVFAGRHEPRKGLQVLLRAWPEIRRRTGARLVVAGADPLAVRLLLTRLGVSDDGIDVVGFLSQDELTDSLALDEGARRAVARRRELRHGPDPRVRLRDARASRPTSTGTARS